ncbi:hypothetical protein GC163_11475 [bacterium]|nr:hypothetical protein [bacterium]
MLGLFGLAEVGQGSALSAQDALPPVPAESSPAAVKSSVTDALLQDRPIGDLQASLSAPTLNAPENLARPRLAEAGVAPQPGGLGRGWCLEPFDWEASAMRHRPLYFEEPNLERMGYYYGAPGLKHNKLTCNTGLCAWMPEDELLQPFVSAAHFYGRVAAVPYMMGVDYPWVEIYTLGDDRPGSCVPYRTYLVPLSLKGALLQGKAVLGLAYIIP